MPKERKRRSAAAAASGRLSEGFGAAGQGRYTVSADKYKARYNAFWKPAPNQSLKNEGVLHFQLTTRSDQMIR